MEQQRFEPETAGGGPAPAEAGRAHNPNPAAGPLRPGASGLVVDLFAGGGGASAGIEAALGRRVDVAINHDAVAMAVHKANHPATRHLEADIWEVRPAEATGGRSVDVLWASPDCTHFSVAKGDVPRKQNIRSLAWAVVRWAAAVQPSVIFLENVAEFRGWGPLGPDGRPDKRRMGTTFQRWRRKLERLGYVVDHRVLDASHYGAPTRRKRLFIVARRDGLPIRWPMPTHGSGPGLLPVRTAAECIDWSLPCPSIFERKRPLAEKTLWRIAQGIRRFVLENPRPFIVRYNGAANGWRGQGLDEPLTTQDTSNRFGLVTPIVAGVGGRSGQSPATPGSAPLGTVTAKNDRAVIVPSLVEMNANNRPHGAEEPLGVVTTQHNRFNLLAPSLVKVNHGTDGKTGAREHSLENPLTTVTAKGRGHALVTPVLATIDQRGAGDRATTSPEAPLPTTVVKNRHALVAPTLVQTSWGEREGQRPRYLDLHQPLGTVVAGGQKHALVSAFLAKHFGGVVGTPLRGADEHGDREGPPVARRRNPRPLQPRRRRRAGRDTYADSDGSNHIAEVRAFLTAFYSTDGGRGKGQRLDEPARTITARHRLGLVTVEGVDYQIVDIGMRMLEPHELLTAQFGRFAASYDLSAARTKAGKVRLIGNSVSPETAEALVRSNLPSAEGLEATA